MTNEKYPENSDDSNIKKNSSQKSKEDGNLLNKPDADSEDSDIQDSNNQDGDIREYAKIKESDAKAEEQKKDVLNKNVDNVNIDRLDDEEFYEKGLDIGADKIDFEEERHGFRNREKSRYNERSESRNQGAEAEFEYEESFGESRDSGKREYRAKSSGRASAHGIYRETIRQKKRERDRKKVMSMLAYVGRLGRPRNMVLGVIGFLTRGFVGMRTALTPAAMNAARSAVGQDVQRRMARENISNALRVNNFSVLNSNAAMMGRKYTMTLNVNSDIAAKNHIANNAANKISQSDIKAQQQSLLMPNVSMSLRLASNNLFDIVTKGLVSATVQASKMLANAMDGMGSKNTLTYMTPAKYSISIVYNPQDISKSKDMKDGVNTKHNAPPIEIHVKQVNFKFDEKGMNAEFVTHIIPVAAVNPKTKVDVIGADIQVGNDAGRDVNMGGGIGM